MTNLKKLVSLLTFAAVVALAAIPASAGNLEDAQVRALEANQLSQRVVGGTTGTKLMNLKHTAVAGSTGAYVTITSLAMTFYTPAGTADTNMGTSGVVTFASTLSSDTMGGLCDYINSKSGYSCTLRGARRGDSTAYLTTQTATDGTNNLEALGGFDITNSTDTFLRIGINPKSTKRVVLKSCQAYAAGTPPFTVTGALANTSGSTDQWGASVNDVTQDWVQTMANATLTYIPPSSQYHVEKWLKFAQGAHVVVAISDAGSVSQTSADYLTCQWDEE